MWHWHPPLIQLTCNLCQRQPLALQLGYDWLKLLRSPTSFLLIRRSENLSTVTAYSTPLAVAQRGHTNKKQPPAAIPNRLMAHLRSWHRRDAKLGVRCVYHYQGTKMRKLRRHGRLP